MEADHEVSTTGEVPMNKGSEVADAEGLDGLLAAIEIQDNPSSTVGTDPLDNPTPTQAAGDHVLKTEAEPVDVEEADKKLAAEPLSKHANQPIDVEDVGKVMPKQANEPIDVDTPTRPAQRFDSKTTADNPVNVDSPGVIGKPPSTPTTRDNPVVLLDTPINVQEQDDPVIYQQISLQSAYQFVGVDEFVSRDQDERNARYAARNSFEERPKLIGYGEVELFRFQPWYQDFRFAPIIDNPIDGDIQWDYRLVIINPKAPEAAFVKHRLNPPRIAKFKALALKFYVSGFAPRGSTTASIQLALDNEITIMIVAVKRKTAQSTEELKPMYDEKNKNIKIIGAITFSRTTLSLKKKAHVDAYISWFLIAKHDSIHPSQINGWRRQGFGLFMIIAMIKHCVAVNAMHVKTVDVFLQSYEVSATNFYEKLGFCKINTHYDDGFQLLPQNVRTHLGHMAAIAGDSKTVIFHRYDKADESQLVAYQLMRLRSGCLQHIRVNQPPAPQASDSKYLLRSYERWCNFPPPSVKGQRLEYSAMIMRNLFVSLPLVKALLPGPIRAFGAFTNMFTKGDMIVANRLDHTNKLGLGWMASAEIDLMVAILMFDGRYQNRCFVMPTSHCDNLWLAFGAYVEYKKALKIELIGLAANKKKEQDYREALATKVIGSEEYKQMEKEGMKLEFDPDKLAMAVKMASSVYLEKRTHLLKRVVHPNPGLLARQLIVFPCNEGGGHWSATFVFNAAFINDNADGIRACFFRYCSLTPNGTRPVFIAQGIKWFLNLCYSFDVHRKKHTNPSEGNLEWLEPFGDELDGRMLGTATFPALRMPPDSTVLPIQHTILQNEGETRDEAASVDKYNCGIGIIAGMAMVLRDIVRDEEETTSPFSFENLFLAKTLKLRQNKPTGEIFGDMPHYAFQRPDLPRHITRETYLPILKEQWFVMFDRLAQLQHDTVPRELWEDWKVPDYYTKTRPLLVSWPAIGKDGTLLSSKKQPNTTTPQGNQATTPQGNQATTPQGDQATTPQGDQAATPQGEQSNNPTVTDTPTDGQEPTGMTLNEQLNAEQEQPTSESTSAEVTQSPTSNDPITFTPIQLHVPLKRKKDVTEEFAELLLKKIRIKDPADADKLEKARMPLPDPTPKVCSQSKQLIDSLAEKYGHTGLPTPPVMKKADYEAAVEDFIAQSFAAWKWHTAEQHQAELDRWARMKNEEGISKDTLRNIDTMIKALQDDRAYFRKFLANEYKCTQTTLVRSVKFDKVTNTFRAKLVWTEEVVPQKLSASKKRNQKKGSQKKEYIQHEEEIEVEEDWLKDQFEPAMMKQIINMRQDQTHWTQAPRDVAYHIGKKKIIKVRYVPETVRSIVDAEKLAMKVEKELKARGVAKRKRKAAAAASPENKLSKTEGSDERRLRSKGFDPPSSSEDENEELKALQKPPRKNIKIAARWLGKTADGNTTMLEEDYVRKTFGDCFTDELKQLKRAFVDIPVGDFKPSRLHDHVGLKVIGAPQVHYVQSEGKDLCVSKSLASALHALGWKEEASQIDAYGENILKGAAVDALRRVAKHARTLLPNWIVMKRLPIDFDWQRDLKDNDVLVGVMLASDDSCSHAVTIHGNFIYDANETIAIRLCEEGLNYCTSTETVESSFVTFKLGYRFFYEGKRPKRLARMKLPTA